MTATFRGAAMRTALKGTAYAAPVILAATVPSAVSAQVSGGLTADAAMTAMIVGGSTVHDGGTITILVTATNNGPDALTNPSSSDAFTGSGITAAGPAIVLVSAVASQGTYGNPSPPVGFAYTGPGRTGSGSVFWLPGPLATSQSATLTLVVRVTLIATPITAMYDTILFGGQNGVPRDPVTTNNVGRATFTAAP